MHPILNLISFLNNLSILLKNNNNLKEEEEEEEEEEALSGAVPPENKSTTVGLSDLSHKIINQLLRSGSIEGMLFYSFVVSLVGMAGIGKTHLAALIYHHPLIVQHFHVRLWVGAGPKYQPNNIYVDILSQLLHKPRDLFKEESQDKLIDLIGSRLKSNERYLIVLDDLWTQVHEILIFLHQQCEGNRSRFLITTRLQEVAAYESYTIHQMPFLNNEESWNLLWMNVFVDKCSFPPQLEKVGRKIAENCEGLPLLILAVNNIICGLDKREE